MIKNIEDRIAQRMRELNLKQVDLVRHVGVSKGTISMWIRGTMKPNGKNLLKLADVLEVTPDWILTGKNQTPQQPSPDSNATSVGSFDAWDSTTKLSDDEVEIPFFMDVQLAAGSGAAEVLEKKGPKLRFAKSTLQKARVDPECAACVKVSGTSMEPVLPDGSVVGVNVADNMIIDGSMYAINHDGLLRIKLLYLMPGGGLRVRSYNDREYPDEIYNAENALSIRVIGKVFWYSVLL
ncbi:helix-turn-helix transcriptional regulator [Photobacterium sp. 1_MG-2023]|uniref:helix-turn-helix transcriptional regulator n=1 Tax=Photobacterium sp. 1_MG-2023 TaxID=3062646 RepID=UPI0026E1AD1E|nr:helix-turn-helix transcriptional regulator [Photobacterium sp. 1_MG-2023]MDO6706753.1 helix-turn-helix transcriptional regulator [Photobacterium sp. 1_MG-2023]